MSLRSLLPQEPCPSCEGRGTKLVSDATRDGRDFAVICARCEGVGIVNRHLDDRVRPYFDHETKGTEP